MNNKKKSFKSVDPLSNVVNALSKASETISDVQNALLSPRSYKTTTSASFDASPISASSVTIPNYLPQFHTELKQYDSGGFPRIDIISDFMVNNHGVSTTAWLINIYVAGVPKENVSVKLDEGLQIRNSAYNPNLTVIIEQHQMFSESNYFLKESKSSYTTRTLSLPIDVDIFDTTDLTLKDGVLSFKIARNKQTKESQSVKLEIK